MSKINQKDLVLHSTRNVDPNIWNEGEYSAFVDELCRGREYQKEAIFAALRFLLGGKYQNLRDLARENYDASDKLKAFYGSWDAMESRLQMPDILSCTLDLATGTGKSYALYGIAAIMLAHGTVKRVLTLCPSLTIERGLTEKFRQLAADSSLRELMPDHAAFAAPKIIDASHTVEEGCICVENYHAVLKHVESSVYDSFAGRGGDSLVLNDEAHHVASESSAKRGKWKEFLTNPKYGFRRVAGASGTCYVGNDYFSDVVSRYSLRQAIEDKIVKNVEYVTDAPHVHNAHGKWQLIHQNHCKNAHVLRKRGIRPLSIVVTSHINACERVAEELRDFLAENEGISAEDAAAKVLVVTSSSQHQRNIPQLKNVDNLQSKVEWIISVSMLSEGWDVKNVFQIVPHEERAFNSKLLIAQVLGRGLRVPESWGGGQPVVTVFNHDAWAAGIRSLVEEILDIEQRISSVVIPNSPCHFSLHNLEYNRNKREKSYPMEGEYNLFEAGYVSLPTATAEETVNTEYTNVRGSVRVGEGQIVQKSYTVEQIAADMLERLAAVDSETAGGNPKRRTNYAEKYPQSRLETVIMESVKKAGIDETRIPDSTRQKLLGALNVTKRAESKRITYETAPGNMTVINTAERHTNSCSAAELIRTKTVFYRSDCIDYLPREQKAFFGKITDQDGDFSGRVFSTENDYLFKSPVNLAIADHTPERKFIRQLCSSENTEHIDGWIKNTDAGFYAIEYAWGIGRPGRTSHTKRGQFSPDFFIKLKTGRIFVVEIKDDAEISEPSPENIGKYRFAAAHFQTLNKWLENQQESVRYQFNMLTPRSYKLFFGKLGDSDLDKYTSDLDAAIRNKL